MRTLADANGLIERLLDALEKHHSEDRGYQCDICGMEWEQYPMHLPFHGKDYVYIAGSRRHGWLPKKREGGPMQVMGGQQQKKSVAQQISDNFEAMQDDAVAEEQKQEILRLMATYVRNTTLCKS